MERSNDPAQQCEDPPTARVLIVEDHALLANALAGVLSDEPGIAVCGTARDAIEAVSAARSQTPNVALVAYHLPGVDGLTAAAMIRSVAPATAIVFHTGDDEEGALLNAIDAGAAGFLTRSAGSDQIIEAVRRAAQGEVLFPAALFAKAISRQRVSALEAGERARLLGSFTRRELQLLHLLAEGLDTTAMADRLEIADHTVEWHVRHIIEKLQVHSKLQAVIAAARLGIIEL
jgi:DNA-binding NarL/FixJ family response regulator